MAHHSYVLHSVVLLWGLLSTGCHSCILSDTSVSYPSAPSIPSSLPAVTYSRGDAWSLFPISAACSTCGIVSSGAPVENTVDIVRTKRLIIAADPSNVATFPHRAGPYSVQYTFDFEFHQTIGNRVNNVKEGDAPITIGLHITNIDPSTLASIPDLTAAVPIFEEPSTTWISYSQAFVLDEQCKDCKVLLSINHGGFVPNPGNVYHFRNVRVTRQEVDDIDQRTTHHVSELAVASIPTMPAAPASATQTGCPHTTGTLKLWQDASTWQGGVVPDADKSDVMLPENTRVLIEACSLPSGHGDGNSFFGVVTIPATSELIFAEHDISFHAESIVVKGHLYVGSETCRLSSHIDIVLRGRKNKWKVKSDRPLSSDTKAIAAIDSGEIDMHGKEFYTWSRLAQTVFPGDRHIILQNEVNWEPGHRIVLATSIFKDHDEDQNEERVVYTVDQSDKRIVWLEDAVDYVHYAGPEYQTEVALLSRNIQVRSLDSESAFDGFGGHTIVTGSGSGRFAGVAAVGMGQTNVMGRYPFHFHMLGSSPTSYVKDCAVERSYFRCVTIHGSHNTTVSRNTAFESTGSCFYLEDGIEEDNTLHYNFGARANTIYAAAAGSSQAGETYVANDDLLVPSDVAAAVFYISNAHNSVVGNAASGGWTGFSFPNFPLPTGASNGLDLGYRNPSRRNILQFDGNSAHSSGSQWNRGSCMYVGGELTHRASDGKMKYVTGRVRRDTISPAGEAEWMVFTNVHVFMCTRGFNHWGTRAELHNFESADTLRSAVVFGEAYIKNARFTGRSAASWLHNIDMDDGHVGFRFYDTNTKTMLDTVTFVNYELSLGDRAIAAEGVNDKFTPEGINTARNVAYVNVTKESVILLQDTSFGASWLYNIVDYDGTLSMRGTPTIIGSHDSWWNFDSSTCTLDTTWDQWLCDAGDKTIASIDLIVDGLTDTTSADSEEARRHTGYFSLLHDTANTKLIRTRNPTVTGVDGQGWLLQQFSGSPTKFTITDFQIRRGKYIVLVVPYPEGTTFSVHANQKKRQGPFLHTIREASTAAELFGPEDMPAISSMTCDSTTVLLCETGSVGPAWHFNGTHFFLRIVDIRHYASKYYDDGEVLFVRGGMELNDIDNSQFEWVVEASCTDVCDDASRPTCRVPDASLLPLAGPEEDMLPPNWFCEDQSITRREAKQKDENLNTSNTTNSRSGIAATTWMFLMAGSISLLAVFVYRYNKKSRVKGMSSEVITVIEIV